jgi:hypothetical protein
MWSAGNVCVRPDDTTGYEVTEIELEDTNFDVWVVCATGYGEATAGVPPSATACFVDGGEYMLDGCIAADQSGDGSWTSERSGDGSWTSEGCGDGYYLDGGLCTECTLPYGAATATCTTAADSVAVTAMPGYFMMDGFPTACAWVDGAAAVTCTNMGDSVAVTAMPGYFMDGEYLTLCEWVEGAAAVTCTNMGDSVPTEAAPGYFFTAEAVNAATCVSTAADDGAGAPDYDACAAVTALDDNTACDAVLTASDQDAADAKACTYAASTTDAATVTPCTPIDGVDSVICTNAYDSVAAAYCVIGICDDNAYCTNTVGTYTCTCNDGYTGSGHPGDCTWLAPDGLTWFDHCDPTDDQCGHWFDTEANIDYSLICHTATHICAIELGEGVACVQNDDSAQCGPDLSCADSGVCTAHEGPIDCTGVDVSLPCHVMLLVDELRSAASLHDIDREIYCPCQFVRENAADWSPELAASCPGGGR